MKKLIAILNFILITGLQAGAQDAAGNAKMMTDKMKTDLSLSDGQYDKVYAANLVFAQGLADAKAGGASKMKLLKKAKALDKDRDKSLKEILTKEQVSQYESTKKENRKKMKEAYKSKQ